MPDGEANLVATHSEFGDQYPSAEVTGTDLSPMQPSFVPPNVRFEIDNAEAEWTWDDDTFDFIHIRTLTGSIKDWDRLYAQAFRCLKPGGWLEHHENSVKWACQNDTITDDSALGQWHKVLWRAGELMGQTFKVVDDDIQKPGMERAGFSNLNVRDLKAPYGDWAQGRTARAIGNFSKLTFEDDPEGRSCIPNFLKSVGDSVEPIADQALQDGFFTCGTAC